MKRIVAILLCRPWRHVAASAAECNRACLKAPDTYLAGVSP
jgi:hypothetical protein